MRNFRRETISFRMFLAISFSLSVSLMVLKNFEHSVIVIRAIWSMLRSFILTQSISFFSLAPLHVGQGIRLMNRSSFSFS
ncbi:MAG: hypothetical protein A4E64_01197 [Syntrophorhabdus sp. PtaU1.Bin058]|nr:MAG: hypothetical protein A4E64_01197 [Syntrophorhabdus sp. PtaU1.Bin058]